MASKINKYLIYILLITHVLLIQVVQFSHIHTVDNDNFHDIIHHIHPIVHESIGHHDDYHQHDHHEFHFNADRFFAPIQNKFSLIKDVLQNHHAILTNFIFNPELDFQLTVHTGNPSATLDWHCKPFQGRSPPFFV